jgi:hypothetical protein
MVKPPLRTKTLGTKLSEPEYAQLEAAASERGLTLSDLALRDPHPLPREMRLGRIDLN